MNQVGFLRNVVVCAVVGAVVAPHRVGSGPDAITWIGVQ